MGSNDESASSDAGSRRADATRASSSKRWLIWLAGGSVGCVLLVAIACGFGLYGSVSSFGEGRDRAEESLLPFVEAMAAGDFEAAHAATTEEFRTTTSMEQLRALADEGRLDEFQSLSVESWHVNNQWGGPSTTSLRGTIHLHGGDTVTYRATMLETGESYRVHGFHLEIPLDLGGGS